MGIIKISLWQQNKICWLNKIVFLNKYHENFFLICQNIILCIQSQNLTITTYSFKILPKITTRTNKINMKRAPVDKEMNANPNSWFSYMILDPSIRKLNISFSLQLIRRVSAVTLQPLHLSMYIHHILSLYSLASTDWMDAGRAASASLDCRSSQAGRQAHGQTRKTNHLHSHPRSLISFTS